jgi:ubiquinone/menaquinone biosynthesis C-methylase UbiE
MSEHKPKVVKGLADTVDWYNKNSDTYARGLDEAVAFAADSVNDFLEVLAPHAYILEAGCGPGRETRIFNKKGVRTLGVDLSDGLLNIARKRNPDTEYLKADFRDLPLEDESFDGVFSHASLVHLETVRDVKQSLREFCRVLKRDGLLLVKVKTQTGEKETDVVSDSLSKHDRFFRYYQPERLNDLLAEAGFRPVSSKIMEDGHGRKEVQWLQSIVQKAV